MSKLIKANFYRLFREKSLIVSLIVIFSMALLSTLSIKVVNDVFSKIDDLKEFASALSLDGKTIFLNSLSVTNNFGLLCPVFVAIYVCKDYQYGTIRNQIISGHSRTEIYLSSLIVSVIYGAFLFFLNSIVNLIIGSIFGGFDSSTNGFDFLFVIKSLSLSLLIMIVMITFTHFLCLLTKNLALSIIFCIVSSFVLSIFSVVVGFQDIIPTWLMYIISIIPTVQNSLIIGNALNDTSLSFLPLLIIFTEALYIVLISYFGIKIYKRSEIK